LYQEFTVNLGNLLLSISDAMDLAAADISSHQLRTGYIAWRMARAAKLDDREVERVFVAALLHDIGALSLEEKQRVHRFEGDDLDLHCRIGAELIAGTPVLAHAAEVVRHHHRQWMDWDRPITDADVLAAQILLLADFVERQIDRAGYILHQQEMIVGRVQSISGQLVHPDVVELLVEVARPEEFWFDLVSPRIYSTLLHNGPHRRVSADLDQIESVAKLLSHIVDYRSRYTSTHSAGVAESAMQIARRFGLGELDVRLLGIAGVTHDLGKLAVPNAILDKPDRLTPAEAEVMRQHSYFTYAILKSIEGFGQIADWAGLHHEKLDGEGYPFRLADDRLSTGARILAVADVFTALVEDRPYRQGFDRVRVQSILQEEAHLHRLDRRIVDVLFDNYSEIRRRSRDRAMEAHAYYQKMLSV
jgi:HD-GYP domain-containing protein (c-di-GMP phosphodiesterase class II)